MTLPRKKKSDEPAVPTIGGLTVCVAVTEEDLAAGKPRDPDHCPLAIALKRSTGRDCFVLSDRVGLGARGPFWALPVEACAWLRALDSGQAVAPALFSIQLGR